MSRTVLVSGRTYFAALDWRCSSFLADAGFPTPERRKMGRGESFAFTTLTDNQIEHLLSHLDILIESSFYWDNDATTRAERASFRRDAQRIRRTIYGEHAEA